VGQLKINMSLITAAEDVRRALAQAGWSDIKSLVPEFYEAQTRFQESFDKAREAIGVVAELGHDMSAAEEKLWRGVEELATEVHQQLPTKPCFAAARKHWARLEDIAKNSLGLIGQTRRMSTDSETVESEDEGGQLPTPRSGPGLPPGAPIKE
jgi:hypothetical protein